jgi:hypothetical protein
VRDQFLRVLAGPHSRYLAEADVRHLEDVLARMNKAFPNRYKAEKTTLGNDVKFAKDSLVAKYGASRVLFGSGFPESHFGGMMLALKHARIPDEAKSAIAGGNLERLRQRELLIIKLGRHDVLAGEQWREAKCAAVDRHGGGHQDA